MLGGLDWSRVEFGSWNTSQVDFQVKVEERRLRQDDELGAMGP